MSSTDTSTQQSANSGVLVAGVDAAVSTMVSEGRLAGPASVQDNLADLVPSNDALGAYCSLADGSIAIVLLVPAAAEEIAPGFDGAMLAGALAPVLDTAAAAMGQSPSLAQAVGSVNELATILAGAETIVAAGVFDGSDVAATVVTASGASVPGSGAGPATAPPAAAPIADLASMGAQVERGLSILADVNLEVTAELGRTSVSVNNLLNLEPGAVLELNNPAGSPVDLFVNGTLFARAEVVVVNDTYAVRISHLVGDGAAK